MQQGNPPAQGSANELGLVVGKAAPGVKPQQAVVKQQSFKSEKGMDFRGDGFGDAMSFSDNGL